MIEKSEYWIVEAGQSDCLAEVSTATPELGNELSLGDRDQITVNCTDEREQFGDCIFSLGLEFIVSPRAAELFQKFRLCDPKFVPLTILDENRQRTLGKGVLLSVERLSFIDLDLSSYEELSPQIPKKPKELIVVCWYNVPPVVYRKILADWDFATALYGGRVHVCSDELKNAIENNKLQNFKFSPLDVR